MLIDARRRDHWFDARLIPTGTRLLPAWTTIYVPEDKIKAIGIVR